MSDEMAKQLDEAEYKRGYRVGHQAATAAAEAEWRGVVEKLVEALEDCSSTMNVLASDSNANVKQENVMADQALALAAPLLKEATNDRL